MSFPLNIFLDRRAECRNGDGSNSEHELYLITPQQSESTEQAATMLRAVFPRLDQIVREKLWKGHLVSFSRVEGAPHMACLIVDRAVHEEQETELAFRGLMQYLKGA